MCTLVCALAGCGGSATSGFQPGPHPALPHVSNLGGPILDSPTLISVTYPGDPLQGSLDTFTSTIFTSSYWMVGAEYGVKSGHAGAAVHRPDAPPTSIDDTQLQQEIPGWIADGELGQVPSEPIYIFYFPAGVQVTNAGQQGCIDFGGYHSSVPLANGSLVAYAVIPRCSNLCLSPLDSATSAASHEIMEASTDPYFENRQGAWGAVDAANIGFSLFPGAEVGDLCLLTNDNLFTPTDLPYLVQRIWSNAAAAANENPCVPVDGTVSQDANMCLPMNPTTTYFNSVPVLPDKVTLNLGGGDFQAEGLSIPVGGTKTITLQLFSSATTTPWSISSDTVPGSVGVNVSFEPATGTNGGTVQMTVQVPEAGNYLGLPNLELFYVKSSLGAVVQAWPVIISN